MAERIKVMAARREAVMRLSALALEEIPGNLSEIQQLRLKLSKARAVMLVLDTTLQSLYERELPRSTRTIDQNAFMSHMESRLLVEQALALLTRMKDEI